MKRLRSLRFSHYLTLVLMAGVLSLTGTSSVHAFDNVFPDPADTEGNSTIWAYNGETRYVRQTDSALRIWFPNPNGTVNITNPNFCASNSPDYVESEDGGFPSYGNGTNVTRFHFFNASVDADRYGIKYGSGDARCNDTKSISFSGLTQQENGYYFVNLDVIYVANANAGYDGGMNGYKLSASGGAKIGVRSNNAGRGTTQEQTGGALSYINYYAPFGAPCDMSGPTTATLQLYDIDNVGGSGAQPAGGPEVRVRIYNITNGVYVDFAGGVGTTWRPNGDNVTSSIDFTARPGRKYRLELLDVYQNNTIQYGVPFAQIFRLSCAWSLSSQTTIDGGLGPVNARRGTAHTFRFRVNLNGSGAPNVRVVERWTSGNSGNIYDNDWDFPPNFDDSDGFTVPTGATPGTNYCMDVWYSPSANDSGSENSNNACIHVVEANMSAIVDHTPPETSYVEIGGTVTSNARISNTGTSAGNLQYTYQMWYEVDGITSAADRVYDAGVDQQQQFTNWTNITAGIGQTPINPPYTRAVTNPPANASHVCSRLEIRRQAGDYSIITTPVSTECTPIGKAPSFAATAGNVRTGGNYGAGTCSVWKPGGSITTDDALAHYFGIISHNYSNISATPHHSYFRDAAVSPGYIDNVVTKQAGIGDGTNIELHFARGAGAPNPATARGGGLFYGSSGSSPAAGTFPQANPVNTHCLTNLFEANRYPAATTPNNVTLNDTEALPAPVAGSNAVTYNICGTVPNNQLILTGPGGGELVLQPGQQYVVRVTQNGAGCNNFPVFVRINSNIRYTGTNAPIDQLPQLVFLAGTDGGSRVSILVDNAVTRLDGIYANRGTNDDAATFLTCAQRANPANLVALRNITIGDCSNPLTVNGAVVLGGRLDLYRAAGHGSNTDTSPAEVFNLRPDTILSDYARDRSSSQLEIFNQRELAPRF